MVSQRRSPFLCFLVLLCLSVLPAYSAAQNILPFKWIFGSTGGVNSIAYSADGTKVYAAGYAGLTVTTLSSGAMSALPTGIQGGVAALSISNDGKFLIDVGTNYSLSSSSSYSLVEVWNLTSGKLTASYNLPVNVQARSIAISPDDSIMAVGGSFDTATGQVGWLELLSATKGTSLFKLSTSCMAVDSLAFSPSGTQLISSGIGNNSGGVLEIWNPSTGLLLGNLPTGLASDIWSVAVSKDGKTLADVGRGTSNAPNLELWSLTSGSRLKSVPLAATYDAFTVAFSSDGKTLGVGGASFNLASGQVLDIELYDSSTDTLAPPLAASGDATNSIAFSPDGKFLVVGSGFEVGNTSYGSLQQWAVGTQTLTKSFNVGPSPQEIDVVAFSPDGKTLAAGGYQGNLTLPLLGLWDANLGTQTATLATAATEVICLAYSPDGSILAVGGQLDSQTSSLGIGVLELWNTSTKKLIASLPTGNNVKIGHLTFSPDGKTLAVGGSGVDSQGSNPFGSVELWDVPSQTLKTTLTKISSALFGGLIFSKDAKTLYDSGAVLDSSNQPVSGILESWNLTNGNRLLTYKTKLTAVYSIVLSPDGSTLVAGGEILLPTTNVSTGSLEAWTAGTGASVAAPAIPSGVSYVTSITLTPDGKELFAATDQFVQEFNLSSKTLVASYYGPFATSVALTSDGSLLGIGTSNGNVEVSQSPAGSVSGLAGISVAPSSVLGGNSATGTVTLTGAAPSGGTAVTLSSNSSSAAVPASVTVTAGATTATFAVSTTAVSSNTTATITAKAGTVTVTATLAVTAQPLSAVSLNPTTVVGGSTSTGTVTLSSPAPSGGTTVSLSSSSTAAIVPGSVTVAAGASTATFTISTSTVVSSTSVVITAKLGAVSKTTSLAITPPSLTSVALSPTTVVGGISSQGTVKLSGPAPAGGVLVNISSSSTSAGVPTSITVAAGSSSNTFTVTTSSVTAATSATITATLGTAKQTANLTINPLALSSVSVSPASFVGGSKTTVTGTAALSGPAGSAGASITLTSSNPAVVAVPATVKVVAGQTSIGFAITHKTVTTSTTVTITAKFGSVTQTTTVTVSPFQVSSLAISPTSVVGGGSATGTVTLNGTPLTAIVVKLMTTSKSITIPATVTVPAGSSSVQFTVKTLAVSSITSATVTATLGSSSQQATLSITAPALLSISVSPTTVKGSSTTAVTGTVTLSGIAPTGGLVVSLKSSNTGAASVPTTVTVLAGKSTATFTVKHAKVTANTTVTLTATLATVSKTATLTVTP